MLEKERLQVVKRIQEDVQMAQDLKAKKKVLENLAKSPLVKKYFALKKEVERLEKLQEHFKGNIDEIIQNEFENTLLLEHKNDIWMYTGSFSSLQENYEKVEDENQEGFEYNEYRCLENSILRRVHNWQEFEKNHFVLKNREDMDVEKYQKLYYQLLFENPLLQAQEILIDIFHNKQKTFVK